MNIYKRYGLTFRKIRKQRGFTLNQFSHLGISSAALCKFENGNSMLKFDKLIVALENLSVTLSEYEKCLNNYDLDTHEILIQDIIIESVKNDVSNYHFFQKRAECLKENELALGIKGQYRTLKKYEIEKLVDYFENIYFWRYTDLYTLYLSLKWFKSKEIIFIVEDFFLTHKEVLNSVEHRNRVTHIICKAALMFISKNEKEWARRLLNYLANEDYKHTMFTENLFNFVEGCWISKFIEEEKGEKMVNEAIERFDKLSYPGMANYYRSTKTI